jgi:hypothetical protein
VGRFPKRRPLIIGQRMSGQKIFCLQQGKEGSQSGLRSKVLPPRCVLLKPSPPILLPLTTPSRKPTTQGDLLEETQKNRNPDRLKPPIIEMGSERMDRPTVGTTISFQTQRPLKIIKIPLHIPMAPQPWTSASRTPRRTRPRVLLSHLLQELDIDIEIQYQVRSLGGITEDFSPGRDDPSSVIPSFSLQLILRRKKTYTTNGEILDRVLGRIM